MTTTQRVVVADQSVTLEPVGLSASARSATAAAVDASVSDNTRTAYTSDWARFEYSCTAEGHEAFSAEPLVIAASAVIKSVGGFGYAPATLTSWTSSINNRHTAAGHPSPGHSEVVPPHYGRDSEDPLVGSAITRIDFSPAP